MSQPPSLDPRTCPRRPDLAADFLDGKVEAERFVAGIGFQVVAPLTALSATPSPEGRRSSELLRGEVFTVYEEREGWCWGQSAVDDYVGYVARSALMPVAASAPDHGVGVLTTLAFRDPDLKSPIRARLSLGAQVRAGQVEGDFTELDDGGWVFTRHLDPLADRVADYVATAALFVGVPYLWGGRSSAGVDCSGLVQLALARAGLRAPRDSDMQAEALGVVLDREAPLQRGDLVFFKGHVGLMEDETTMLHANARDMMVSRHRLDEFVDWLSARSGEGITGIRRLRAS